MNVILVSLCKLTANRKQTKSDEISRPRHNKNVIRLFLKTKLKSAMHMSTTKLIMVNDRISTSILTFSWKKQKRNEKKLFIQNLHIPGTSRTFTTFLSTISSSVELCSLASSTIFFNLLDISTEKPNFTRKINRLLQQVTIRGGSGDLFQSGV